MSPIRIPTPDAPAAHHLTFICAVAELTHRVLERVTGLQIDLHVTVHDITNPERTPALVEAAKVAGMKYTDASDAKFACAWYDWKPGGWSNVKVTIFTPNAPLLTPVVIIPETNIELRQDYDWAADAEAVSRNAG